MATSTSPLDLLEEWLSWWAYDPATPAKLPDALQVRTGVALAAAGRPPDLSALSQHAETGRPADVDEVLAEFDRLWHRCRHSAPDLTRDIAAPHELRTGETPATVMEQLRRGVHVHEQGPT